MRIVVTNAVLTNSGDAAILQGIEESLKFEDNREQLKLTVFDNNARVSSKIYPHWNIMQQPAMPPASGSRIKRLFTRISRLAVCNLISHVPWIVKGMMPLLKKNIAGNFGQAIKALAEADVVISSGGTYLVDHYDFRPRITELKLASSLGKPVVLWTQSMGPFKTPRARKAIARIDGIVSACYFRDDRSLRAWQSVLQNPPIYKVVPDIALSLESKSVSECEKSSCEIARKPRVAISVREWGLSVNGGEFSFENYASALRDAVIELDKVGYDCVAISTCQGTPGYSVDDSKTAHRIFHGLPVTIDNNHHSPDELLCMLEDFDIVLATRMHLAILSLVARRPVIAIAYESKTSELFGGLGLEENVISIEELSSDWIIQRIDRVVQDPSSFQLTEAQVQTIQYAARTPARDVKSLVAPSMSSNAPA